MFFYPLFATWPVCFRRGWGGWVCAFAKRSVIWALAAGCAGFWGGTAAADGPGGKDGHPEAEAFEEGPRQAAVALRPEQVGRVEFKVTTSSPQAQRFFEQGVAQLHAFWFYEAERSFRQVLLEDPRCGMAYWGLALANRNAPARALEFLEKIKPMRAVLSAKEKRWVDAYLPFFAKDAPKGPERYKKLVDALETMAFDFPQDIEIKAWVVFHLWDNTFHGVPLSSYEAVDALIREVLDKQPMHPGAHHLRIHLWNGKDDRRALKSAALCGQSGPVAAHLWHMPGHTFSSLKRYADAAWQQEAAARSDHAWMEAHRLLPDEIHNYAHNNDWLVENLGYLGRVREAQLLARNLIELPRLAPHSHVLGRGRVDGERSSHAMGARRLVRLLVDYELWEPLLDLRGTPYLEEREDVVDEAQRLSALVWAQSELRRSEEAALNLERLKGLSKRVRMERLEAAEHAEQEARKASKPTADAARAAGEVLTAQWPRVEKVDAVVAEGCLAVALAAGEQDEAGAQLAGAKELSKVRRAVVKERLGQGAEALKLAREAATGNEASVLPVAALVWHLWREGVKAEALEWFGKLRKVAGGADEGLPILGRLQPVAQAAGVEGDWRQTAAEGKDAGVRPELDALGPFRWRPRLAPAFHLECDRGGTVELGALKGKPVLLVFYLGSGCVHCIEQLNLLAPLAGRFAEAGIEIYAVSTEAMADLPRTTDQAKSGAGFPFPLLADPSLAAFRMYRAYDDFEQQALHGLFLLDGAGYLRWQNISKKPFSQLEWLLKESRRLLVLPAK